MQETSATEPSEGYLRLIDAAEELLDEHGIDGVSARAIVIAAGHRNTAAVNYHFGDRATLVRAVLARHAEALNVHRHAMLDALGESPGLDAILHCILDPLVALLDDPSGRRYIRLLNEAASHPRLNRYADHTYATSLERAMAQTAPHFAHLPVAVFSLRARMSLGMALFALSEQARLIDSEAPTRPMLPTDEFAAELLATVLRIMHD